MEQQITICISCRQKGSETRPGYELIDRLRRAFAAAGASVPERFEVSHVDTMEEAS